MVVRPSELEKAINRRDKEKLKKAEKYIDRRLKKEYDEDGPVRIEAESIPNGDIMSQEIINIYSAANWNVEYHSEEYEDYSAPPPGRFYPKIRIRWYYIFSKVKGKSTGIEGN